MQTSVSSSSVPLKQFVLNIHVAVGVICFGWMWMDRFSVLSFSTDPLIYTHTYIHFALRKHRFRHYFCLTATQTGLQKPGVCSPLEYVRSHTQKYTHSDTHTLMQSHMCVTLPALRLEACRSHLRMPPHMCCFVLYVVLCILKRPTVEALV